MLKILAAIIWFLPFYLFAGFSGRVADSCGNGIMSCAIIIDGVRQPEVTGADGNFYFTVSTGVKKNQPIKTAEKKAELEIFSLDGRKVNAPILTHGIYLVKTPQRVSSRVIVGNRTPMAFFSKIAVSDPAVFTLGKETFPREHVVEFRDTAPGHEGVSMTLNNLDTIINVKMIETRITFVSALQRDSLSYFVSGSNPARNCFFYLFKDDQAIDSIAFDGTFRILESGKYTAKFKSISLPQNPLYACNKDWDSMSFVVKQPDIDQGPNFVIKDDPTGFGKIVEYQAADGAAKTIFVQKSRRVSVKLQKPFFNPKTCDTMVTIDGSNPHPDYYYFHFGNQAGRKVLVIYSYDLAPGQDTGAYHADDLLRLVEGSILSKDTVTGIVTSLPKEKISPETHDVNIFIMKTTASFFRGLYDFPVSEKADLFFFFGHGDGDKVIFDLRRGEYLFRKKLLDSLNADTLARVINKFSSACVSYFLSCDIADNYSTYDCWAKIFAHVFQMSIYGSSTPVCFVDYGDNPSCLGWFHLITPAMYEPLGN